MVKAIGLLSGGLDSTLAVKLMLEQGIEIEAVNFLTVFCNCTSGERTCLSSKSAAEKLGIKLKVFEVSQEYLEVIKNPRHGYGRNLNPCLDCRIFMLKKAAGYMRESGASFMISGDVLGERPMSQRMEAMRIIERESGLEGLILRPLSAKLFPPTIPEKEGWVRRDNLLALKGRSRRPQIKLAEELDIHDYPCPAGGCLLTDDKFSDRFRDLMKYRPGFTLRDVKLLKVGRHFRLAAEARLVVGRNEKENARLAELAGESDFYFIPAEVNGPTGLGRGIFTREEIILSSQIIARYSDRNGADTVRVVCRNKNDNTGLTAAPLEEEKLVLLRI